MKRGAVESAWDKMWPAGRRTIRPPHRLMIHGPMVQKHLAPWDHKQGPTRQWLLRSAGWTDPFVEKSWLA